MKIKQLKIINQDESTEVADIGANAENVDYNNINVKLKLDELSNNIDTNTTNISNEMITRANAVTNLQSQVNGLASGSPLVASSVSGMTNTNRVYVNTTDGHWYYYNGNSWVAGGVYQATEIASGSISLDKINEKLKFDVRSRTSGKDNINFQNEINFNFSNIMENGGIDFNTGELKNDSNKRTLPIYLPPNTEVIVYNNNERVHASSAYVFYYDEENYLFYKPCSMVQRYGKSCLVRILILTQSLNPTNITIKLLKHSQSEYISENLFNPNDALFNGYISTSQGHIELDNSYKTTEFIKIKANQSYIISKARKILLYDKYFNAIPSSHQSREVNNYTFTPEQDGYLLLSYSSSYENTLQVCEGSSLPTYKPYQKNLPTDVQIKENNLSDEVIALINNITTGNILYNKKYVSCGDSFTEGAFQNSQTNDYIFTSGKYIGKKKVYPYFIGNRNNMTVVNEAISGTTMTYIEGVSNCFSASNGRYTKIPADADYITLKFGINDGNRNVEIGTIDDNVNTTFYGAWNIVLDYIIRNHPNAKIGIIVTNGTNINIVNATINIAKKWGIPYLDEATGEQVPLLIRTNKDNVDSSIKNFRNNQWFVNNQGVVDGVNLNNWHPNEKCHEYESTIVENWLRSL